MIILKRILKTILLLIGVLAIALWVWWPTNLFFSGPLLDMITGKQAPVPTDSVVSSRFKVPEGLNVKVFAKGIPHARMMVMTTRGDIIVSSVREGKVYLIKADSDGDGISDGKAILLENLDTPHGVALRDGWLYIAEVHRVSRIQFDSETNKTTGDLQAILVGLPAGGNHNKRTIAFGPDGMLYLTIGSSCNVCIEDSPFYAAMLQMTPQGKDVELYATGLRNTVGFDWKPDGTNGAGLLFGTDNGRDMLGDDTPNDEFNMIQDGAFYGWPHAYDDAVADPDHGEGYDLEIKDSIHPYHGFGAHRAPLGMRFLNPKTAPSGYDNAALVALHGSWNSSTLVGYKVVALNFDADGVAHESDFMTGFELHGDVIGRPVDIVQDAGGAIYVSDDYAGVIYSITKGAQQAGVIMPQQAVDDPLKDIDPVELMSAEQLGALLFDVNGCASCHMAEAVAEGVAVKELKGLKARYTVDSLSGLLKSPPSPMPTVELTDSQRRALSIYLLSTAGE